MSRPLLNISFALFPFTRSQLGPRSSLVAYLERRFLVRNKKVTTCRVRVPPAARGIRTTCGSYSDGTRQRRSHVRSLPPVCHAARRVRMESGLQGWGHSLTRGLPLWSHHRHLENHTQEQINSMFSHFVLNLVIWTKCSPHSKLNRS